MAKEQVKASIRSALSEMIPFNKVIGIARGKAFIYTASVLRTGNKIAALSFCDIRDAIE